MLVLLLVVLLAALTRFVSATFFIAAATVLLCIELADVAVVIAVLIEVSGDEAALRAEVGEKGVTVFEELEEADTLGEATATATSTLPEPGPGPGPGPVLRDMPGTPLFLSLPLNWRVCWGDMEGGEDMCIDTETFSLTAAEVTAEAVAATAAADAAALAAVNAAPLTLLREFGRGYRESEAAARRRTVAIVGVEEEATVFEEDEAEGGGGGGGGGGGYMMGRRQIE